jgi:hypothetical protein
MIDPDYLARLKQPPDVGLRSLAFGGADLSGATIAGVDLRGADLRGADLSGARIERVDLMLADLRGADLTGAAFRCVLMGGALLAEARCKEVEFELCRMTQARLSGAGLCRAVITNCDMEGADLSGADLIDASVVRCNCNRTDLSTTKLDRVKTQGSTFVDASLEGARSFWQSHEIVGEILAREMPDDFEIANAVASVTLVRRRCWPEWGKALADRPQLMAFAEQVFARYPESGCLRALRAGTRGSGECS